MAEKMSPEEFKKILDKATEDSPKAQEFYRIFGEWLETQIRPIPPSDNQTNGDNKC